MYKLVVKKTYCPDCKKLVKTREQKSNDHLVVLCPKCSHTLWTRYGMTWRSGN
jgi:RNase P subunit RPR2